MWVPGALSSRFQPCFGDIFRNARMLEPGKGAGSDQEDRKEAENPPHAPRRDSRPSTDDLFDVLENTVQLIEAVIGNDQLAAAAL